MPNAQFARGVVCGVDGQSGPYLFYFVNTEHLNQYCNQTDDRPPSIKRNISYLRMDQIDWQLYGTVKLVLMLIVYMELCNLE